MSSSFTASRYLGLLNGVGKVLVENAGRDHFAQRGVMLQLQVHIVDAGLAQAGVAFEGLQGFKVESTERGLFAEHGAGEGFAVSCAQVGGANRVHLAQDVGQVQGGQQVCFFECAGVAGQLFGRLVGGVAVAFDAHGGGLHAEAHVSAEALIDAGIQHGVGSQDVQEPGV